MENSELGGRTEFSDVIVGCVIMVLSVTCGSAYLAILVMFWRDGDLMKMASYKIMFALGVFDVIQCLPHFVTGLFTIFQTVWHPLLAKDYWGNNHLTLTALAWVILHFPTFGSIRKAMGVLATPAYVAYTVLTLVLSFNRCILLYSPYLDSIIFNGKTVDYWIGLAVIVWVLFVLALSMPWATIHYFPDLYSWDYDYTLSYSFLVQKAEMVIELSTILLSAVFYGLVIAALYRTRKRFFIRPNSCTEIKILIQALVITVYCTVLNFLWHNSQMLPGNVWSYMTLNMMWILNIGIYPVIYFVTNRVIRDKITSQRIKTSTVSVVTKLQNKSSVEPSKWKMMRCWVVAMCSVKR